MNLKDNDDEIELTGSSSHQQGKQPMSSQEEHKTAKRPVIESDYSDNNNTAEEDLCETSRGTQSVGIGSLNQLNVGTGLLNQFNVSTGLSNQLSVGTGSSNQLNVTAGSSHHLKVDTGSLHCLKVSTGSLNQFNVNTGSSNQLNVTAGSSHHEKSTDVEETYFLLQPVYLKMGHKINVEAGVTEDLDTTEIIDKNSNTIAEQ